MGTTAWSIQRNINATNLRIGGIDSRIRDYETMRSNLQRIKGRHELGVQELESSYNKMANSSTLSSIKQTGVFEGAMADSLTGIVRNTFATVLSSLRAAKSVSAGIDTQITKIDTKIRSLEGERSMEHAHITNLHNDLRRINTRRR